MLPRQQLPCQPCACRVLKRHAAAHAVLLPAVRRDKRLDRGFDAVLSSSLMKALPEALQPLLARQRRLVHRRGDERRVPVSEAVQMVGQHCACALVAQLDGADRQLLALLADQHERNARRQPHRLIREAGQERINNAADAVIGKLLQIVFFQLPLAERVADQHAELLTARIILQRLDQLGIILVRQRGRQDQNEPPVIAVFLSGAVRRRLIAELPGRLKDARSGLLGKRCPAASAQNERNAGLRYARKLRDVCRRRFSLFFLRHFRFSRSFCYY